MEKNMERHEFYKKATAFIVKCSGVSFDEISPDTHLVNSGIVDSLLLTELIFFVENVIGHPIDIDNFRLDSFESLQTIYDTTVANNERLTMN